MHVTVPVPSDIDMLIEKHENIKNATKCAVQIISRQSLQRKEIIFKNEGNILKGKLKFKEKNL